MNQREKEGQINELKRKKKQTHHEIAAENELDRKRKADERGQKETKQTEDEKAAENELERKRKADKRAEKKKNRQRIK